MKTIFKIGLVGAGLVAIVYAVKKTSTYQAIAEKFKFLVGTPRIYNYKDGMINIAISGTKITNQSAVDLAIQKLYTSVQYLNPSTNTYTDLLIQNQAVNNIIISPYSLNSVPDVMLSMPISNLGVLKDMLAGKVSSNVKVLTRFQVAGVEVPAIENMLDFKGIIGSAINMVPGLNLITSVFGGEQNTDTNSQSGVSPNSLLSLLS